MSAVTRGEITQLIADFAAKDPEYRKALLANPKKLLEQQMQTTLPDNVKVKVVEDTPDTVYLLAPYVAKAGGELSDTDLEKVAGGKGKDSGGSGGSGDSSNSTYNCNDTKGIGTRVQISSSASLFG